MDPRLAELYGTNKDTDGDVEKTAAAELAEKLAGENELDLDGLSGEELEALAQEVLSSDEEPEATEEKEEETEDSEESEKTASDETEEKLAEADYIGRVMAHSYVHELKNIEKSAGVKEMGGRVMAKLKSMGGKAKELGGKAGSKAKEFGGKGVAFAKKHKGKAGIGAGVAAAGAAGYAAHKAMSKKSSAETPSALDQLAVARAKEILTENGVETEEKTASDDTKWDALSKAVELRAVELLKAEGYEFQE